MCMYIYMYMYVYLKYVYVYMECIYMFMSLYIINDQPSSNPVDSPRCRNHDLAPANVDVHGSC